MANRIAKNRVVVSRMLVNCFALLMFIFSLDALNSGHIWNFLLCAGCVLTILFGPKDSEFFQTKINKVSDLTKIEYSVDPVSAAFLIMAFLMMLAGLLGSLWFG